MSAKPTREELIVRMHKAMDAAIGLTSEDVDNVQSLIDVGEFLVAFETLCTQIYEWGIALEPAVIRDLESLGNLLGAKKKLTESLWEDATSG